MFKQFIQQRFITIADGPVYCNENCFSVWRRAKFKGQQHNNNNNNNNSNNNNNRESIKKKKFCSWCHPNENKGF